MAFSLEVFIQWIEGHHDIKPDWDESWAQSMVTDQEWRYLPARLATLRVSLLAALDTHGAVARESVWGVAGVIAHTAFLLGAIQVKADTL